VWEGPRQTQEQVNWRIYQIISRVEPANAKFAEFLGKFSKKETVVFALGMAPADTGYFKAWTVVLVQEGRRRMLTGKDVPVCKSNSKPKCPFKLCLMIQDVLQITTLLDRCTSPLSSSTHGGSTIFRASYDRSCSGSQFVKVASSTMLEMSPLSLKSMMAGQSGTRFLKIVVSIAMVITPV
jgi:hypothetical protein